MDNVVNKKKVSGQRRKRYLGIGNHQLLALKEVLDAVLRRSGASARGEAIPRSSKGSNLVSLYG